MHQHDYCPASPSTRTPTTTRHEGRESDVSPSPHELQRDLDALWALNDSMTRELLRVERENARLHAERDSLRTAVVELLREIRVGLSVDAAQRTAATGSQTDVTR